MGEYLQKNMLIFRPWQKPAKLKKKYGLKL